MSSVHYVWVVPVVIADILSFFASVSLVSDVDAHSVYLIVVLSICFTAAICMRQKLTLIHDQFCNFALCRLSHLILNCV